MNAAEIKLDLFRRIDNLPKAELEKVYSKFIALLNTSSKYKLSESERGAISEAIEASGKEKSNTHLEIVAEAKERYPNLKFK